MRQDHKAATPSSKTDRRPTPDQMYLAEKLNASHAARQDAEYELERYLAETEGIGNPGLVDRGGNAITPAALQKWNLVYGVAAVSDAMRTAWGFPPLGGIENPFAYVQQILRSK